MADYDTLRCSDAATCERASLLTRGFQSCWKKLPPSMRAHAADEHIDLYLKALAAIPRQTQPCAE